MEYPKIFLKPRKEESLQRRHPWIFSGAISKAEGDPEEGDIVDIFTSRGDFIARGHCQIGSISVRVLSFEKEDIDNTWWGKRFAQARKLRQALGLIDNPDTSCYRLVHGEGDNLPGLIVDIYGNTAVLQCHSVGMYLSRNIIADALKDCYEGNLKAIYDKSSQTIPFNAGLEAVDEYIYKADDYLPEQDVVLENRLKFGINWERGQKTGFFIDQRENRELVKKYSKGRKVLNTFCYTGGFSAYALDGGADKVVSVDSSQIAVDQAIKNIELNFGSTSSHEAICVDAIDYVKNLEAGKFDMIILDPPAFAKHHKVLGNALQGYKRLNANAILKIGKGGILFTFSCSQAVSREQFRTTVFSAAAIAGRNVKILHQLTQPADHPINIYHPEGEYLKGLVLYVE